MRHIRHIAHRACSAVLQRHLGGDDDDKVRSPTAACYCNSYTARGARRFREPEDQKRKADVSRHGPRTSQLGTFGVFQRVQRAAADVLEQVPSSET